MADTKDELEARRWFRRRLADLGRQYPQLQQPACQERLTDVLDQQQKEQTPWPANPPGTPEADPQARED